MACCRQSRSNLSVVLRAYLDYASLQPRRWRTPQAWKADLCTWQATIVNKCKWCLHLLVRCWHYLLIISWCKRCIRSVWSWHHTP